MNKTKVTRLPRGEQARLARECGITRQGVHQWFNPSKRLKGGGRIQRNKKMIIFLLQYYDFREVVDVLDITETSLYNLIREEGLIKISRYVKL